MSKEEDPKDAGTPEHPRMQSRRKAIKQIAGIAFIAGGAGRLARAGGQDQDDDQHEPPPDSGSCGAPDPTGVGYVRDSLCKPNGDGTGDSSCGLLTNNPASGGAHGGSYGDNDCNMMGPFIHSPDNDCGKLNGWTGGGHKDAMCGQSANTHDADCNTKLGVTTVNTDQDCEASSSDSFNDCWFYDSLNKPKPGDDPHCLHFPDSV